MSSTKTFTSIAVVVALLAITVAVYESREVHAVRAELEASNQRHDELLAKFHELENRAQSDGKRAQAAEEDSSKLLKAIESARAVAIVPTNTPITQEIVQDRYRKAQELARSGNWEAALPELLWCYDEGMVRVESFTGVRSSFLLSEIAKLAANYPPAMAALRERRDKAEQRMLSNPADRNSGADVAALNKTLGEDGRNLELFDKLPPGDPRRQGMLVRVYDQLIDTQRYADAAAARTYDQMSSRFDSYATERPIPATIANPELIRQANRRLAVTTAAKDIEVLAGAGKMEQARALAGRVLAYDSSDDTKAQIQERAARAGHPELLSSRAP
jgi:hypothetical protein